MFSVQEYSVQEYSNRPFSSIARPVREVRLMAVTKVERNLPMLLSDLPSMLPSDLHGKHITYDLPQSVGSAMQVPRTLRLPPSHFTPDSHMLPSPGMHGGAGCMLGWLEPRILSHHILLQLPLGDLHAFTICSKSCHRFVQRELHTRVRVLSDHRGCVEFIVQSSVVDMNPEGHVHVHTAWYLNQIHCFIHRLSPFFELAFSNASRLRTKARCETRWKRQCIIVHGFAAHSTSEAAWAAQWDTLKGRLADSLGRRQGRLMEVDAAHPISVVLRCAVRRAAKRMDEPTKQLTSLKRSGFPEAVRNAILHT